MTEEKKPPIERKKGIENSRKKKKNRKKKTRRRGFWERGREGGTSQEEGGRGTGIHRAERVMTMPGKGCSARPAQPAGDGFEPQKTLRVSSRLFGSCRMPDGAKPDNRAHRLHPAALESINCAQQH